MAGTQTAVARSRAGLGRRRVARTRPSWRTQSSAPDAQFPFCFRETPLTELPTASCPCHVLCGGDTGGAGAARVPQPPVWTLVAGSRLQSCQACSCHSSFQLQLAYCLVSKSLFCTNVAWSPCPALAVCLPDTPFFEDLLLSEFPLCRPRSSGDRHQGARVCSPRDGSSPPGAASWLPRPPR